MKMRRLKYKWIIFLETNCSLKFLLLFLKNFLLILNSKNILIKFLNKTVYYFKFVKNNDFECLLIIKNYLYLFNNYKCHNFA